MRKQAASSLGLVVTIILIGINLRPFMTGPGPVIDDIILTTGMSFQGISLLTLLPMLLMGVGALIVPALNQRWGERRGISWAMLLLLLGSFSRLFVSDGLALLMTAFLCGLGAAYIQAVLPGLIKSRFPKKMATMTGLYSATMMIGGAIGAQLTPILAESTGHWQSALAWLALPALVALFAIIITIRASSSPVATTQNSVWGYLSQPRAWLLMVGFGLINAGYGTVVTWLAPFFQTQGLSASESGSLLAILTLFQAAAALMIPVLASHNIDRRFWLTVTLVSQAVGFAGLMLFPNFSPLLWCGLLGSGLGGCFALTIIASLDHLPHPVSAGVLTAFMQAGGFIIAGFGPLAAAVLQQVSQSFTWVWGMHVVLVLITLLLFLRLNPKGYSQIFSLK
ncbi:cyanate transporter [Providencia heimbachae]|uniref:Cyanate transport protein n=1 Tax=Providencia heimbachae ATCC 35613 TaxID=1354272 RepID=A0A1B7JPD8_9GAMM|nr:cyanate transporter [Providencia heimbachae]OAT49732.1 cyanate transport protein [Providencia heimbachae ATCC 35613]SQH12122.1 Inner membrane transport protein YeaN [Providencia heimbachae]